MARGEGDGAWAHELASVAVAKIEKRIAARRRLDVPGEGAHANDFGADSKWRRMAARHISRGDDRARGRGGSAQPRRLLAKDGEPIIGYENNRDHALGPKGMEHSERGTFIARRFTVRLGGSRYVLRPRASQP